MQLPNCLSINYWNIEEYKANNYGQSEEKKIIPTMAFKYLLILKGLLAIFKILKNRRFLETGGFPNER